MLHRCTWKNTKLLVSWATIIDLELPVGIQDILMRLETLDMDMSMETISSWGNVSPHRWLFQAPSLSVSGFLVRRDSHTYVLTLRGKTWEQVWIESLI